MTQVRTSGALFAGIGGICLAVERAGYRTSWAIDHDAEAQKTYKANFNHTRHLDKDIRDISVQKDNLEPVDLLHAGFPCQSFSKAGERRGFKDERGKLFFEIIRLIGEFGEDRPSILLFENAPYLRYGDGGSWFLTLQKQIQRAGYWFRPSNAAELDSYIVGDLPQRRERLYMVAFCRKRFRNGRFSFPGPIGRTPNLDEYINFKGTVESDYYMPVENRYHHLISQAKATGHYIYQLRKYEVRRAPENTCPTLTANMGLGGHNVPFIFDAAGLRKLTERECARLQGFPDSFVFPEDVGRAQRYKQIGNAVPVPVLERIATRIKAKFDEECSQ